MKDERNLETFSFFQKIKQPIRSSETDCKTCFVNGKKNAKNTKEANKFE